MLKSLILLILLAACGTGGPLLKQRACGDGLPACPQSMTCALVDRNAFCQSAPLTGLPVVEFPIVNGHPVRCQKSDLAIPTVYDLYALYFSSMPGTPPASIRAAHDGQAFVYNECPNRDSQSNQSEKTPCGMGLGNHVRIIHSSGMMSVYAHLSEINIQDREQVFTGQLIGLEGSSGNTGQRTLRFSVHFPMRSQIIQQKPGVIGPSHPFKMRIGSTQSQMAQEVSSLELPCQKDNWEALIFGVQ